MKVTELRQAVLKMVAGVTILGTVSTTAMGTDILGGLDGISAVGLPTNATSMSLYGPNTLQQSLENFSFYTTDGFSDGAYRYQVFGKLDEALPGRSRLSSNINSGRVAGAKPTADPVGVIEEGTFRIIAGSVAQTDADVTE